MAQVKTIKNVDISYPAGFQAGSMHCGIKGQGDDMSLLLCPRGAAVGGILSANRFRSLSLDDTSRKLGNRIQALLVFSGNANACTGRHAADTMQQIAAGLKASAGIPSSSLLMSFTGVVGWPFPAAAASGSIDELYHSVYSADKSVHPFYKGIMTTDTRPKVSAREINIGGIKGRISGCAKGAGMIYPNMATMLAYITTDIAIPRIDLQRLARTTGDASFNSITIDGDMSTNDTYLILSSGESALSYRKYKKMIDQAVMDVACDLALEIVRDGEGATKLITVDVVKSANAADARKAAERIANSLLVKTAVFGGDPNYGRILVALGASGVRFKADKVELYFGDIPLYRRGAVVTGNIKKIEKYLKKKEVSIRVSLGMGKASCRMYTCDISYEYVRINSEYTT